jgi:hypothetical protein
MSFGGGEGDARQGLPGPQVGAQGDVAYGSRHAEGRFHSPVADQALDEFVQASGGALAAGSRRRDLAAEVLGQAEAQVLGELLPPLRDLAGLGSRAEGLVVSCFAHGDPLVAHVAEPARAGGLVVEVGNQLAEDPRLVGVGDPAVSALDDRLGNDSPPREVP